MYLNLMPWSDPGNVHLWVEVMLLVTCLTLWWRYRKLARSPTVSPVPRAVLQLDSKSVVGLFHRLPVASLFVRAGRIAEVNHEFRRLFGLQDADDIDFETLWLLAYPNKVQREKVRADLLRRVEEARRGGGRLHGFEMNFVDDTGRSRTFLLSGAWFGKEALISLSDITDQRHLQERLHQQEDRLMVAVEVMNDGVWEGDCITGEVSINHLYAQLLGFDSVDDLPRHYDGLMALVHPDDHLSAQSGPGADVRPGARHEAEVRMRHRAGHYVWVQCQSRVIDQEPDGRPRRVVGTIEDITQRKRMESDLRRAFSQQLAVFDAAPVGICIFSEGRLLQFNRMLVRIFQADRTMAPLEERLHRFLGEAGVLSLSFRAGIQRAAIDEVRGVDYPLASPSGENRWLRVHGCAISDAGMPDGMVVAIEDVTESRRLMAEWERAKDQALAAQRVSSNLRTNFRHEMNTPFNAMLGFSELIAEHSDDQGVRIWAQHIQSSARELHQKLQMLSEIAQLNAGTVALAPVVFRLDALLDELLSLHRPAAIEKGLQLNVVAANRDLQVTGDRAMMLRAISPVLDNAIRYTPQGLVRLEMTLGPQVRGDVAPGSLLVVRVLDSGGGFDLPDLNAPFLPLSRGDKANAQSPGGMGLGLALARAITHSLGGEVTIARSDAGGSEVVLRFSVELPRA